MKIVQMNPKEERLPAKNNLTGGFKPMQRRLLLDPDTMIGSNPRVKKNLAPYDPVNVEKIRAETLEKLNQSVEKINRHINENQQFKGIKFSVHSDSNRVYAVVVDKSTGQVLKTIPSKIILEISGRLQKASGILVNLLG